MKDILSLSKKVEDKIQSEFKKIDEISMENTKKVLNAFNKYSISEIHFAGSTGYGYDDIGRTAIEQVFADVLGAEDSLVRTQIISGTHALTVTMFGILRPGDIMLSITGKPYDTLDEVIGIKENTSSLKAFGINYEQVDLVDEDFNIEEIRKKLEAKEYKLIAIQRSRGYSSRASLNVDKIGKVIKYIKELSPNSIIMVDNCYGEFVEANEPTHVGADLIVGSLIKNLGGGLAPNGGYIAGKKNLIEQISQRLTAPGLGKEVGATLGINKSILQGLFMAPHVVAGSMKIATFAAKMLEELGYVTYPKWNENKTDIVLAIVFNNEEKLIKFCQGIQAASPIDSHVIPEPWAMPGYGDKVIMASGAFTSGSSIEISCDGPIRPPYIAFLQGGLTYESGKFAVLKAITNII